MRFYTKLSTKLSIALLCVPGVLAAQDLAIRNATLITIANGDVVGNIVVRGGKITAVGANAAIPAGIKVIEGTGKFVMQGIIDAHSHAALENGINEEITKQFSAESLATRDRRNREIIFNPEVDKVWAQVDRLVGAEMSAKMREILKSQSMESSL